MRRVTGLSALLLLLSACGGGSGEATTTVVPSSTTAAATTSTAAATTTSVASGPAAFIAAAQEFLGEYEGEWNNTTFDSSGSVYLNVLEVNTEAGFILIQVDLGGNVFGQSDPELFAVEISASADGLDIGATAFLNPQTIEVGDDGHITVTGTAPSLGMDIIFEGDAIEAPGGGLGFEGTYSIPGLAEGTWYAHPAG